MVLGTGKDVVASLLRKVVDLKKDMARCKRENERAILDPEAFCTRDGYVIQKISEHFQFHRSAACPISCWGPSVVDLLARKPYLYTFKDACDILSHCDFRRHQQFVTRIIADYAVLIYGFPECPAEDLYLAVFFFIEEVFGIKSNLELCYKFTDCEDVLVGVVFDTMETRRDVLRKTYLLDGIDIEVEENFDINWIVEGFLAE